MTSIPSTTADQPNPRTTIADKLAIAATLTALADWMFFKQPAGLSVAPFLVCLVSGTLAAQRLWTGWPRTLMASGLLLASLAPIVENLSPLSAAFGCGGAALAASILTRPRSIAWPDRLLSTAMFLAKGPFRLLPDLARTRPCWPRAEALIASLIPLALGAIFLSLFASANPIIAQWLVLIDPRNMTTHLDIGRLLFWFVALSCAWPFVSPRWRRKRTLEPGTIADNAAWRADFDHDVRIVFGAPTILRSLVLFNLLFGVETILDLTYLWGGATLPDGLTYASYAHRGAYPLVLTTLLAAGFILAATQEETTPRSRLARGLIYLWTAQNVLLTFSSVLRLGLYIETYSLTYLRVAAFVWMGLVAAGLVLIVVRMALRRSNGWLLLANLAVLAMVLYGCAFVNFPSLIGSYNVAHSRDATGQGTALDLGYLLSLGPQALPAIDRYIALKGPAICSRTLTYRDALAAKLSEELGSWRSWSFRDWRLYHDLARQGGGLAGAERPQETAGDPSHSCR